MTGFRHLNNFQSNFLPSLLLRRVVIPFQKESTTINSSCSSSSSFSLPRSRLLNSGNNQLSLLNNSKNHSSRLNNNNIIIVKFINSNRRLHFNTHHSSTKYHHKQYFNTHSSSSNIHSNHQYFNTHAKLNFKLGLVGFCCIFVYTGGVFYNNICNNQIISTIECDNAGSGMNNHENTKLFQDEIKPDRGEISSIDADEDDDETGSSIDSVGGVLVSDKQDASNNWILIKDILRVLGPDWILILGIIIVTGASAAINIYTPTVIGELATIVQCLASTISNNPNTSLASGSPPDLTALNVPAFKLLVLFVCQGFFTFIDIDMVTRLGERVSLRLKRELFGSLLNQDLAFFDSHMQGELVGRLTQDVGEFKHTFKLVLTQGLKCITQIIGSSIHLLQISTRLTFTLVSTMPILYLCMNMYGFYLRRISRAARVEDSFASGVAGEAISNIRTVKAFASEDIELEHFMVAATDSSRLNSKLGFNIGIFQGITNASIGGMILLILYYGGSLVGEGEMTGGQLMSYMISTQNAQRSLAQVGVLFGQVIKSLGSASRVFEYIHSIPKIPTNSGYSPKTIDGFIEFKNISFVYPTRPNHQVLSNFNLKIPMGKVVAVCGPSGSGKSTIGQLIERFYDPDSGTVMIDGRDIRDLNPCWIRKNIGYINQEPILFATSILDNIKYGNPDATLEQVVEAARSANAADFIEAFPDGYETVVGERGVTLSGGQKQRIAIARALLKNPKVLILDEATSALDNQSEKIVQEALEKLMKDRTVLVIAHRLSTIQSADVIVVMNSVSDSNFRTGNVVEMGTHDYLLRKKGAYYKLYEQLSL